jgi:hypothetical protein
VDLGDPVDLWAPLEPGRPTVLLAMTWHRGGMFSGWGSDADLLPRFLEGVTSRGAQVIVRMHDRHRYEPAYLNTLEGIVRNARGVAVKFKSDHPDSLADLWVSSVMVSNYSSILNHFYHTGFTAIHVDQGSWEARQTNYTLKRGKLQRRDLRPDQIWKIAPADVGGPRARTFDELQAITGEALSNPTLGAQAARDFLRRHHAGAYGETRANISDYVTTWLAE